MVRLRVVILFLLPTCGWAFSLPGSLSAADLQRVTQLLAMGGTTRILRSAEAYPSFPGLKIGLEITALSGNALGALGNQLSALSTFLPVPRVFLAKGLFPGAEVIFSFLPASINTLAAVGGILKWTLLDESQAWATTAVYGGITGINAFQGEFQGATLEIGALWSKDYVRLKPYVGGSVLIARGSVLPALALDSSATSSLMGTHFFIGGEVELPVNLTLQVDLINLDPAVSIFIGKKF